LPRLLNGKPVGRIPVAIEEVEMLNEPNTEEDRTSNDSGSSPEDSIMGKILGGIGTALTLVIVLWISNKWTGRGNFLFPPDMEVLKQKYSTEPSQKYLASEFYRVKEEQDRLGEWERSQDRINARVDDGEDLGSVVVEEIRDLSKGVSTVQESLQVSGFWPYMSEEEQELVRKKQFDSLPGDSPLEFMALLRVRRFKGVKLWDFMSKEHQEFAASTRFDQLSAQEQLEWSEDMLLKCMENGWGAEDE
jgi:hypothetical protein